MELYWSAVLIVSLFNLAKGSLLCSVCSSLTKPDCETKPPPGELCWQSGQGVDQSCTVIREYKINTKIQLVLRRDCSTMRKGTCYDPEGQNRTVCIDVCFSNNCNSAPHTVPSSTLLLFLSVLGTLTILLPCLSCS